jgi:long-chain-fatty-acid--[acyl-carrier-protein] ligase
VEHFVKKVLEYLIAYFLKLALWFRYRIRVEGFEKLTPETLNKPGGVLFLPNHPTYYIDPVVTTLAVWPTFPIRPMVIEYMYYAPGIHWLLEFMDALPIPNFVTSTNSLKKKKSDQVFQTIIKELKQKRNFLVYPSGKVKHTALESIGGASGVHHILQETPEANVVLVRVKGLWGSSFSRALTGKAPSLGRMIKEGIKTVLKNLLFFTPRREIIVELEPVPVDFPYHASRVELNKYLENWYNRPDGLSKQKGEHPGDSLVLVSYSMWGEKYLPVLDTSTSLDREVPLQNIPKEVQDKIVQKIAELTECPSATIKPEMTLASDLGLDSLDISELIAFLHDQFDVSNVPPAELTTVGKLMAIASKLYICREEDEEEIVNMKKWNRPINRFRLTIPPGQTIHEVFLNTCATRRHDVACADMRSGVQTYEKLKVRLLLIARYVQTLPGKYVGILLPASVGANLLILGVQLAGKIPLMVNWTIGPRHLESVVKLSDVQAVLTSWAFLDRLENVDFNGIEDNLIMLEDVIRRISLWDKIKAYALSKRSTHHILKAFNVGHLTENDQAVLLFTSGTESMPKGVPLTNRNLLSNQRAALNAVDIYSDDVILSILPPFHSFGFTVSGLLGLLAGCRIAFSPDPTDGKRLAHAFERWNGTIMCGAPTFIKGMLKAAVPSQLKTMRLCVTGAEKAPADLIKLIEQFGKADTLVEGYGITECSPVLTFNPVGGIHRGVGKALPGVQLSIVNPETGNSVPNGTQGLILARGPNVFSGYLNPGISSPFVTINGKQWYKTGDLGFLDDEGYLTISGRMKRFVKMGAEMISLASIEDALIQTAVKRGWPLTEEGPSIAVCAKELPGEKTKIYVFSKLDISIEEINKSLKEAGFSNLVRVTSVTKVPEIPVMGTGKINYRTLESDYLPQITS